MNALKPVGRAEAKKTSKFAYVFAKSFKNFFFLMFSALCCKMFHKFLQVSIYSR